MILADPRFTQVEEMLTGLDQTFPDSKKIGVNNAVWEGRQVLTKCGREG